MKSSNNAILNNSEDNRPDLEWFINESPELAKSRNAGVDLWALWANLHRSVSERLRRHHMALDTIHKLRKASKL